VLRPGGLKGRSTVPGGVTETTGATYPAIASFLQWVDETSTRICVDIVQTPLPHIPGHVIQAPGIGQFLSDGLGHDAFVVEIPRIPGQVGVSRVIP
jgi:hypothetical protein